MMITTKPEVTARVGRSYLVPATLRAENALLLLEKARDLAGRSATPFNSEALQLLSCYLDILLACGARQDQKQIHALLEIRKLNP